MQARSTNSVSEVCASCGGDPGGIVWEGLALRGILDLESIHLILGGTVTRATLRRLFRTRRLRGLKIGKSWAIRASRFVTDWEALETPAPRRPRRPAPRETWLVTPAVAADV